MEGTSSSVYGAKVADRIPEELVVHDAEVSEEMMNQVKQSSSWMVIFIVIIVVLRISTCGQAVLVEVMVMLFHNKGSTVHVTYYWMSKVICEQAGWYYTSLS
eukprot:scaffold388_cov114-Cylindrotheca_fusiformis.AAC.22